MNSNEINSWIVQPPKQIEQVPDGMYSADYKGIVEVPIKDEPKWRFEFVVKSGTEKDKVASALVDPNINPNALAGRLIAGLLGRPLIAGENVKVAVAACVGKPYVVNVAKGPQGGKSGVKSCGKPHAM